MIRDHHEALVSEELFHLVSLFRTEHSTKRKNSAKQNGDKHPLTGKLYCGGCGYSLNYKPLREKNRYRRFECRKHALWQIQECCTYINADLLEETVLMMLNRQLLLCGNAEKQKENLSPFLQAGILPLKRKLEEYRREIKQMQAQKDALYEKYALRQLDQREYRKRADELTEQLAVLSIKKEKAAGKLAALEKECRQDEEDKKQLLRYLHIEKLTQEAVHIFIKRIWVYKDKRMEIEWNFSVSEVM